MSNEIRRQGAAQYHALKTATKMLITLLGGLDAAASCSRVQRSQLSDYGNVHVGERFAPIDVILDLEDVVNAPLVTRAMAQSQGYELVAIEARTPGKLAADLARFGRDASSLFAEAVGVLAGAQPTEKQRLRMLADLHELRSVTSALLADLHAKESDNQGQV